MHKFRITFEKDGLKSGELAAVLESAGFGSAEKYLGVAEFSKKFFPPGTVGVFAFDAERQKLVGFARAFTDEIFTTYISEVCVCPRYQKMGIGTNLVKELKQRFSRTAIFAEAFEGNTSIFSRNHIVKKEKLVVCSRAPCMAASE